MASTAAHPLALDGLLAVSRLVREERTERDLHQAMAGAVCRSLGFRTAVVNLHRRAWDDLQAVAVHGDEEARTLLLDSTTSWADWEGLLAPEHALAGAYFVRAGAGGWGDSVRRHVPTGANGEAAAGDWDPLDALFAPLVASTGEILGVLSVDEPLDGCRPTPERCELLVAFAAHLAHAVETRCATAGQARRDHALGLLADVAAWALTAADPVASLDAVARALHDALGFGTVEAAIFEGQEIRVVAAVGGPPRLDGTTPDELRALVARCPVEQGCRIVGCDDAPAAWGRPRRSGRPHGWRAHSVLAPLTDRGGRLAGVLRVADPDNAEHPDGDQAAHRVFAGDAEDPLGSRVELDEPALGVDGRRGRGRAHGDRRRATHVHRLRSRHLRAGGLPRRAAGGARPRAARRPSRRPDGTARPRRRRGAPDRAGGDGRGRRRPAGRPRGLRAGQRLARARRRGRGPAARGRAADRAGRCADRRLPSRGRRVPRGRAGDARCARGGGRARARAPRRAA